MDYLDFHTCNSFGLHANVKFKAIFKINIVNFLITHLVINFNRNHHKKIERILRGLRTHNGLLEWQHYVCHTQKFQSSVKKEKQKKHY